MNVATKYSRGDTVVVEVDDAFLKAKVQGIRIYASPQNEEPIIIYELLAKWRGHTPSKGKEPVYRDFKQYTSATEPELAEILKLYAKCKRSMEEPTEAKVLWEMRKRRSKSTKKGGSTNENNPSQTAEQQ